MKNYLKPISLTFMASVICVSSAHAGLFDKLDPRNIGKKISETLRPEKKTSTGNKNNSQSTAHDRIKDYGAAVPASATLNTALAKALGTSRGQIGQTAINLKNLQAFYTLNGNRAVWTNDSGLSNMGLALQDLLLNMSVLHGFEPQYYLTKDVEERMIGGDWNSVAELEILLTQGYMLFVKDMTTGRINPRDASQGLQDIEMKKNAAPSVSTLHSITTNPKNLFNGVADLAPRAIGYSSLVESLAKLNDAKMDGGWRSFSADKAAVKPGAAHANVVAVRQRLVDLGYLPLEYRNSNNPTLDQGTVRGLVKYQQQHFLTADGIIGNGTYNSMNYSLDQAIVRVRANLEKWRLMPRNFPARYLFVDMGRQELDIMENNQLVDRMKVVVGKDLNGTPTMTDQVTNIILSPYWHPPKSIIIKEIIPAMANDSAYLARTNMRILRNGADVEPSSINWSQYTMENPPPFLFRQETGPANSLGLVKFDLTNRHSIYLHDTNNKTAFNKNVRYLSHGCIRLERPFDLAAYLLRDQGHTAMDLQARAASGELKAEKVAVTPTPVYIFGTTVVNYADGSLAIGPDIYGQDDRITKALDQMARPASAAAAMQE